MATKKASTAKKGKKASKPLHDGKHLEATKPLTTSSFFKTNVVK